MLICNEKKSWAAVANSNFTPNQPIGRKITYVKSGCICIRENFDSLSVCVQKNNEKLKYTIKNNRIKYSSIIRVKNIEPTARF